MNEIGRWSESSAKTRTSFPPTACKVVTPTTLWVAGILTSQIASVRSMLERIGFDHLPWKAVSSCCLNTNSQTCEVCVDYQWVFWFLPRKICSDERSFYHWAFLALDKR